MPTLPSGQRIEFSLDRFHSMLENMDMSTGESLVSALESPDDLLYVLDMVSFDSEGTPFFMECVTADWQQAALDWSPADRTAFANYLASEVSFLGRSEGIAGTRLHWQRICAAFNATQQILSAQRHCA